MIQCCPNGARPPGAHPALPVDADRLAEDVAALAELGVPSVHLHPRDVTGAEVLAGPEVGTVVARVRSVAPQVEIGVTTAAWIEPRPRRRAELLAGWAVLAAGCPDVASVNVHEDGWWEAAAALADAGIGIELGVFHVDAARRLRAAGIPAGTVRVLAEVQPADPAAALAEVPLLLGELAWVDVPILLHGEEGGAWPVLTEALRRGLDTRIGLEDVLVLPDGTPAADNTALIRAAQRIRTAGPRVTTEDIMSLRGIGWDGDLARMRADDNPEAKWRST